MRPAPAASSRFDDLLRDQSLLLRWLTVIAAVVGLVAAVEAWEIPFPYRLGDYAPDGIAAKIEFSRVNETETDRVRNNAAERVNPIFRLDPAPLAAVPNRLRVDLEQVAAAMGPADLPAETRIAFGLRPSEDRGGTTDVRREFEALQAAVRPATGTDERPIEAIVAAVAEITKELGATGVLIPDELTRNDLPLDQGRIDLLRPDGSRLEAVPVRNVLLTELLATGTEESTADDGRVARRLAEDPRIGPAVAKPLRSWLLRSIPPTTLRYDSVETQKARSEARDAVPKVENRWNPRDVIVAPGARIGELDLAVLRAEYDVLEDKLGPAQRVTRVFTVLMMVAVLTTLNGAYFYRNERALFLSPPRLAVYLAVAVATVALGRWLSFDPWRAEVIPLVAAVMVIAIAYDQVLATISAFTLAALLVLSTTQDLGDFVILMSVSAAAIIPLSTVDSRSKLIKVGFLTGLVYFVVSFGLGVLERQSVAEVWADRELFLQSLKGAGWCLVAGYLVAGSLPFVESTFGVVTDISLLEMTDVSHPLLQELVRRAPGTYNHSMAVATIGETAADAIGANGLLVRVGAYFHDVGKMLKPHYFIENMTEGQRSRHEQLAPAMSTLIIIGHVKDGVDLAREHNLPRRIVDFVEQHHGTTLVEYFYREATRLADLSLDHKADAEEAAFRYPGPKPQTREAGVMMLADAVESASRTLSEPTPKRIESLVHGITLKRLLDGQFDDSGLTLSEIRTVEASLIKSLIGIYHGRIKYPDQKPD